ncbi:MAG: MFS transporter [Desulfobacteraceae bacterium]|jgi:MFS family permease|nr:MAG: MFS transporter [Desulfobacteraceae bacterium]
MGLLDPKAIPERSSDRFPAAGLSLSVWGLGALFYLIGFYLRIAPAVMTTELMKDLGITAAALGNLSAFYFYSYVVMQIPTGILADHWGPRRLLTTGSMVAALGTALFASAPNLASAGLGRLLIGAASAVAFVAILKLSNGWFPSHRYAMLSGMLLLCGLAGAISAGVPLRIMVDVFGWRPVMLFTAAVTFFLGLAIWFVVRDDPSERGYRSFSSQFGEAAFLSLAGVFAGVGKVLRYPNTWILSLAPSGIVGPIMAFSGLWGVPFLSTHYGLSSVESSAVASILLVAWALGGPLAGWISDRVGRRKPIYVLGSTAACICWIIVLYIPGLSVWLLVLFIAATGFSSSVMIIGFAFIKESVPPHLAGTVSGVCNMGVMLGPMILQPLLGWILDLYWNGDMAEGIRIYPLEAYRIGFMLMIVFSASSSLLVSFSRDTRCRQSQG